MALPASGQISMSQVNTELGLSATAQISLNDAAVRTLAGVPSGAISLDDLHGKSAATTYTYNYVSNAGQTFTVPAGKTSLKFKMWGAGGGEGVNTPGGSGGYVEGVITVSGGDSMTMYVPSGGVGTGAGGWPYGGSSGGLGGAGGGGAAFLFKNGALQAVAGGGGGGGNSGSGTGGAGGASTGATGGSSTGVGTYANGGTGGTQSAAGSGGASNDGNNGYAGSGNTGGSSPAIGYVGGAGGGGYYGGGGGASHSATSPFAAGGGGGGSSYIISGATSTVNTQGGGSSGGTSGTYANGSNGVVQLIV